MNLDTQNSPLAPSIAKQRAERNLEAMVEIGLIFAIFFIHAGWPVPEVNETHYLAKAKHYWNPNWCARDFFLNTADAHQVFYWTCGWITRVASLPTATWLGRIVSWLLLAWAWRRLSVAVVPGFLYSVLSAGLLVAATSRLHMAGEWIIGGFEAKGPAYVLVLLALEAIARNRWRAVWPLLGAASAFHVVIGAWAVLAAGVAWLAAGSQRPPLRTMLLPLGVGFVLALPGLLPALALTRGVDPWTAREASRIYVFERLPHHLIPQTFKAGFIRRHLLLWLLWLVLCWVAPFNLAERRVRPVVAAAMGIALVGFAISPLADSNSASAASILRYYWFRMAGILVPLGVALAAISWLVELRRRTPGLASLWLLVGMAAVGGHLGDVTLSRWQNRRAPADTGIADLESWRETCDWIANHTPADALFIVPRSAQTFRWYADRAEVVCRKDIPQDASGIVGWWQRMIDLYGERREGGGRNWNHSLTDKGSEQLRQLGKKYSADYLVTDAWPPLALEQVSPPNRSYVVYRLPR